MSDKVTVFIEHAGSDYVNLFLQNGFEVVYTPDIADVVCFTGGADVSPHLYGHARHHTTHNDPFRDAKEERLFDVCINTGKVLVGICRGGQFLNVMSGGTMYQDVSRHTAPHEIVDQGTGEAIYVSSTHHQMMCPGDGAQIVACAQLGGTRTFYSVDKKDFVTEKSAIDYEVLYYERYKALCFQPHPEFRSPHYDDMRDYFFKLLNSVISTGKIE